ncbi:hypothetical protein BH18ACT9_BH18ACT9_11490 [soil metagenome]
MGGMTDLLTRPEAVRAPSPDGPRRPLWLTAAMAGLAAAGSVLVGCMALALTGWYAADAGAHGDTRDALRVGADAWLLGHGSGLGLSTATISLVPLGLTWVCGYVTYRLARWAAQSSDSEDPMAVVLGGGVLCGVYGVVALLTAVLASTAEAQPSIGRSFLGGVLVALVGGGAGLLASSAAGAGLRARIPEGSAAVLRGAIAAALIFLAAASVLVATALLLDLGTAANVLSRLHADASGGALFTLLAAGVAPNAALMGGAYLLGPGFTVGTGTIVSPAAVVLGPVPAFPLLAALPQEGTGPPWAAALVGVPVLVAAAAAGLTAWRGPSLGYVAAALRSLGVGVAGGLLSALLVVVAGGSVGPGRMSELGAPVLDTFAVAPLAMGVGALVGGLVTTWWLRRRARADDSVDQDVDPAAQRAVDPAIEDTVVL